MDLDIRIEYVRKTCGKCSQDAVTVNVKDNDGAHVIDLCLPCYFAEKPALDAKARA